MPVYEQRYRRLDSSVPLRAQRWIPIAREGLKAFFVKRAFLALLAAAWLPVLGQLLRVYIVTRFPQGNAVLPVNASIFFELLPFQFMFVLVMSAMVGSGLIANDLRTGGILLYLSRPLTLSDYVAGKIAIVLAALASITVVPGLFLFFGARALAPEALGGIEHFVLIPKIFASAVLLIVPSALLVLAASAVSKSARFAGLAFVFIHMGSQIAAGIAWRMTRDPSMVLLSIQSCIRRTSEWIYDIRPSRMTAGIGPEQAALALVLVCVACALVLRARVRAVEIVR